ncbi:hypothetical protein AAG906_018394 [Vitis piasezkii]
MESILVKQRIPLPPALPISLAFTPRRTFGTIAPSASGSWKYLKQTWVNGHTRFVTSNPDNRLISKVLYKGDVFVFPEGLIHFQLNVGKTKAVAIAALSSQNPGVITIANAVFGSKPAISADVLTKAFQVDKKVVDYLQSQF